MSALHLEPPYGLSNRTETNSRSDRCIPFKNCTLSSLAELFSEAARSPARELLSRHASQAAAFLDAPGGSTANGSTDPYPIPWLDKNGSHNQPAGPNLEPSHIYHFKGLVARSSTFTGMGTDNQGNRIAFGSRTTDYGVMQGEYWAARTTQQGTFTHI